MPPKPLACLDAIIPYKGGESKLAGFAKPIKLASNENPLGASAAAIAAYQAAGQHLHLYPDGGAQALRAAIAAHHGLEPEKLVFGAGSDEIFLLLGRIYLSPGDEIIQSQYGFLLYRLIAQMCGAVCKSAPDDGFRADVDAMLALVSERTRIVFLANPNNPTGTYLPAAEVRRLHAGLPEHVLLVLDGAYAEYMEGVADYEAGFELAKTASNVLATRTFSKIYGLAGLRVGYGYGHRDIIAALNKIRGPFNVAAPSQAAAAAAIGDQAFVEASRMHNSVERARVAAALTARGFAITPSWGNFILTHFEAEGAKTAAACDAFLRTRGLIVRPVGAYGLPHALRISIGTEAENDALLSAMADFAA